MGERTKIEWTDASWTPIRARNKATGAVGWHCEHASPGCANCYSETLNADRLGTRLPFKPGHRKDVDLFLDETMLLAPLRWRRPRMIFVCSMTDLFADFVPDAWIDRVFAVMALSPQHTFQVLTKRSARMRAYMAKALGRIADQAIALRRTPLAIARGVGPSAVVPLPHVPLGTEWWPLPNVWLGVSTEDQTRADERISDLLMMPAAVRFVSAEPLLGPIDFTNLDNTGDCRREERHGISALWKTTLRSRLDWIIVGGESGPGARPMHPDWVRSIRDQCAAAGVSFFFKQWGNHRLGEHNESVSPCIRWQDGSEEFYGEHQDIKYSAHWLEHDTSGTLTIAYPCSKKAAGRLLDGVEYNGMPEVQS